MLSTIDKLIADFARTTDQVFSLEEFKELLSSNRKLRIKFGVDVTAPHLHIGHAVNLWMMRQLQEMGHKVIFLIGDFTTRIGDPTGKNKLRPIISEADIQTNTDRFIEQAGLVLRFDNPNLLEIRRNSEWLDSISAKELFRLFSMITHNKLLSRDMFQKRMADSGDIYLHELMYPILQGYDSVALHSDLTIIGSDQLFNEMLGRFYQEKFGQNPQVILTTKITPGIDGGEKQSKSLDNYIGLVHSPRDKFGRVMRIPDRLISEYLRVYTALPVSTIEEMETDLASDHMGLKKQLAWHIVERYHGKEVATQEQEWFEKTFSAHETPAEIPLLQLENETDTVFSILRKCFSPDKSNSFIRKLIQQGGCYLNENRLPDPNALITVKEGDVIRLGKRTWLRITVKSVKAT